MTTIHASVAAARDRLLAAGIPPDEASLDSRLLAAHALGWSTERYLTDASAPPTPEFADRFQALIARRAAREPFAYIVGRQEFWGLEIEVSSSVLIPRPETELIVEAACEAHPDPSAPIAVADVGTGTGCIAVAIAKERPLAAILATDVSGAALDVARRNAERLGVANRITFRQADLLEGIDGAFDLVVSNPPYVRSGDRPGIQPEVQFEPAEALYGGDDGLGVVRRLVLQAADRLKPGGTLIFEFGFGQDDAVTELISSAAGLRMVGLREDLQGIPRIALAVRR